MSHARCRFLVVLLSALATPLLSAAPGKDQPPAKVVLEAVRSADFPFELEFPGRTSGSREVEVRAQVSGILQERAYEEGSQVKKGDVLFRIDPRTYQAAVAQAKAAVAQARYRQAERNLERIRQIQAKGFASGSELDSAVSDYEQARANIEAARAELQARQIDLDYTTVKAPISGITSRETRSEGSLVIAGDPTSSLLTQISQLRCTSISATRIRYWSVCVASCRPATCACRRTASSRLSCATAVACAIRTPAASTSPTA